jgi:hypothetical protein
MPNNADFSKLKNINTVEIKPAGWISNIVVEYGISDDAMPLCCWRVKGTKHTFEIPVIRLDFISSGEYDKHFCNALENFREDYKLWEKEGFNSEWAKEYRDQYSRYIC